MVALVGASLWAQSSPQFEVASVRPSAEQPAGSGGGGFHFAGSSLRVVSLPLREYVAVAYNVRASQVVAPDWMAQARFDVSANMPANAPREQFRAMLQALLADRFQLKAHRESRESPVYALTVAKTGLKIKPVPPDPNAPPASAAVDVSGSGSNQGMNLDLGGGATFTLANNAIEIKRMTMQDLAQTLTRFADRVVVDQTGLTERYDISVKLTQEEYQATMIRAGINAGAVLDPRALRFLDTVPGNPLTALEQAGLALEQRKAPLDVIVVDSASKTPAEN
jgi:uncharacterized protein (TIGR03435 family)